MTKAWWRPAGVTVATALIAADPATAVVRPASDLPQLSIEELLQVDVSSVSKTDQPLNAAPAAIYVITRADIERSGALTVPEMLRLAPNLHVAQTSASRYVITARGFNGNNEAQSYANKLLVLIDGRSVYTPLFSGVYWEMQAVMPQDIDRIEVISGPGAALWGANAVNGVINIITRGAAQTQGGVITASAGNFDRNISARLGGRLGDALAYRVYATALDNESTRTLAGADGRDEWDRVQGGFRLDWTPSAADSLTLQGDIYSGSQGRAPANEEFSGRNLLARWTHTAPSGSVRQVQAYYDRAQGPFVLDTYDLNVQQSFNAGAAHAFVVGGGIRVSDYSIRGIPTFFFEPSDRTLTLANAFVQDSIRLDERWKLVLGLKLEDNPFSGTVLLPSARLAWTPDARTLVWAAVSRAIRSPTPFDTDVVEKLGTTTFLIGNPDFQAERLTAYEAGTRLQIGSAASLSVSLFYNDYDRLRNIEFAPGGFLPLRWGNGLAAQSYGVEAWGDYAAASWWRLSASVSYFHKDVAFAPGATTILGPAQLGNDPEWRASLRSSMTFGMATLDGSLRYVGVLPDPRVPSYVEFDARIGVPLGERLRLSLVGANLLHRYHQEYPAPANLVPRRVFAEVQWRF
ncbi:MAG: TonB-dependent receptor [Alphaproteobacteria bacterium]|nr:MAG: TonB-dependent receptor [Alphaproteobacteria bacterium]